MQNEVKNKSYFIPFVGGSLHLKRFYIQENGIPLLLIHGSMEDGKIFYSRSMKGLAPYLAKEGYDVFVADLSGRGDSKPPLSRKSTESQTSAITRELPVFKSFITALKGNTAQHWIAHSWGGVLMLAYIARFGSLGIASMSFFATKRRIAVMNPERIFKVDLVWNIMGKLLGRFYGYFPSKKLKIGSENEPRVFHRQVIKWVYQKKWIDPEDGFDYNKALRHAEIPPTLYLAAKNDRFLGNPEDVQKLMIEVGNKGDKFVLLSKANGHMQDYDHINILTHTEATKDHFPLVKNWIKNHSN